MPNAWQGKEYGEGVFLQSQSIPGIILITTQDQKGDGNWEILTGNDGTPSFRLTYYNGEIRDYRLEFKDNKLYLNGERYFRTNDSKNSPNCI